MDATCEKLYCTTEDGECIAVDIGTGQVLKVKEGENGLRTKFLKVAVGDRNKVAVTDGYSSGFISSENSSYIFRPFDCAVKFSQVHCGKEHVILLSQIYQVYSFGLGSRGQLGHGTTDGESQPRLLEALGSVPVDTISAGGWHSAVVSTIGDIYVWGWNESGQLGFPMQRKSVSQHHGTSQDLLADGSDYLPSLEKPHSGVKRTLEQHAEQTAWTKKKAISLKSTESSSTLSQSLEDGNLKLIKGEVFETSKRSHGNQPHYKNVTSQTDVHYQKAHQPLKLPSLHDTGFQKQVTAEINSTLNEVIDDRNYGAGEESNCSKEHHAADLMDERSDSRDTILFQPLPRILDLPNGKNVVKVSCGSRHTAAISEDGCLYTWGWDAYGQLGHGDALTRDIPTMVKCIREDQRVIDVSCGAWNTLIGITSYE
ncbi:ultraviolet-B receptor UVR8-like isoform X2 [Patiria miniata]|nr:ultraviolet-B receptor UVR8-like isoform X2 [Patiria miniata]